MTDYTPRARHWLIAVAILLLLAFAGGTPVAATNEKVGICHATNSDTNPYVFIEVSESAAQAHLDGTHPSHHGQTADDEDYLAADRADCETVESTPTPTPTPTPSPTPQETPQETPVVVPSDTPTPSEGATPAGPAFVPDTAMARAFPMGGLTVLGAAVIFAGLVALVLITARRRA